MARITGFIQDAQTLISNELQFADAWEGLKQEYQAMQANGIIITDADVEAVIPGVTAQQFIDALTTMQQVVNFIHQAATAAKLYRVKR